MTKKMHPAEQHILKVALNSEALSIHNLPTDNWTCSMPYEDRPVWIFTNNGSGQTCILTCEQYESYMQSGWRYNVRFINHD